MQISESRNESGQRLDAADSLQSRLIQVLGVRGEYVMSDFVPLMEIAETLGVDPTTIRRLIKKYGDELGITVERVKSKSRNGRWVDCLSIDDRNRLIDFYESRAKNEESSSEDLSPQRFGVFYIIQLIPEALPNRVKIGYTDDLNKRLNEHRTAAPTAKVIGSWPCKRSWDQAAMDSIARENCKLVMNEVYEGDVEGFIHRANNFFSQMPNSNTNTPLSEHSPLKNTQPVHPADAAEPRR